MDFPFRRGAGRFSLRRVALPPPRLSPERRTKSLPTSRFARAPGILSPIIPTETEAYSWVSNI